MSASDFRTSIDFIADHVFPKMSVGPKHFLTVEYLGGEVLVVPQDELEACVDYAKNRLSPLVRGYRHGAQSNLIGSSRRVLELHDLFDGNLGTSWDRHSGQRQIKGSPELYRALLNRSLGTLDQERGHKPGRVLVVDRGTAPHVAREVEDAIASGYDLVLRPVFQGGTPGVDAISADEMADTLGRAYRIWSENPAVRIEPFSSLAHRRARRGHPDATGASTASARAGCPFQSDCAFKSLSLDPDGALHVCQEMADASNYPLGNAISRTFEDRTWRLLARRSLRLSQDCATCEWLSECGGGCMNEAIETHGDPFAKTELCPAWKRIFHEIESDIRNDTLPAT